MDVKFRARSLDPEQRSASKMRKKVDMNNMKSMSFSLRALASMLGLYVVSPKTGLNR